MNIADGVKRFNVEKAKGGVVAGTGHRLSAPRCCFVPHDTTVPPTVPATLTNDELSPRKKTDMAALTTTLPVGEDYDEMGKEGMGRDARGAGGVR
ncbi:hypothetical protein GWI33_011948 [Rhynchophorus ferrugineus]|uniref:Uncharacterized protein n=1 Tax=Rhynchophorus ferrugineus TaxID=354439 RepID=A0A834IU63_RHYFE|nr:hypothetical protein GWI33_011948 [Rhynchophorus ferrugineus]